MAGVLACELGNSDKLSHFIAECSEMGISVLGPDVNESGENFTPLDAKGDGLGSIRFGLAAVKGVGDVAGRIIVEEREKNGPYEGFIDLVGRVDGKAVNKRVLECLIKTGGFDALEGNRAALLADLDRAMGEAQLRRKDREAGQVNLFDLMGGDEDGSDSADDFSSAAKLPGAVCSPNSTCIAACTCSRIICSSGTSWGSVRAVTMSATESKFTRPAKTAIDVGLLLTARPA